MTETFPLFFLCKLLYPIQSWICTEIINRNSKKKILGNVLKVFHSVEVFIFFFIFFFWFSSLFVFQNVFNKAILIVKYYPEFSNMSPYASLWETRKSGHIEQEFVESFINSNFTFTNWADSDFSWTRDLIYSRVHISLDEVFSKILKKS